MVASVFYNRLGGVFVERPTLVREVASSIHGRIIANTLKLVVMAALLGALMVARLALRLTGLCLDK